MFFTAFLPEVFLITSILFQLLLNAKLVTNPKYNFVLVIKEASSQTIFILVILFFLFWNSKSECYSSWGILYLNSASILLKIFSVLLSIALVYIVTPALKSLKLNFPEAFSLILLSIFSLFMLLGSKNLLSFYLAIEMQTICFYTLAAYSRNSAFSTEAGLKYFIAGSFMSGCFLLGAAIIFSNLGTLSLPEINTLLVFKLNGGLSYLILVGLSLITIMLLFKLACAPFHFWAPDVYEGSPFSSTIIFSILPKLGVVYFFMQWFICMGFYTSFFQPILIFIGIFSCFVGTLFSLSQKRLKKLVVYSSIAQVGFIVSGLALNSIGAYSAVLMFLIIYLLTSLLIWGHLTLFYCFQQKAKNFLKLKATPLHLTSLAGFSKKNKIWGISLLIVFFSIAGIPPLTGFLTKILILLELSLAGKIFAAALLILISSVSVYYYIRIIKSMFFEPNRFSTKENLFQVVFINANFKKIYFIFSILLFSLLVIFFFPSSFYVFCTFIALKF